MSLYLKAIHAEAESRGYSFDKHKIRPARKQVILAVTSGQMEYEWLHLLAKLKGRNPGFYQKWCATGAPVSHPLFRVRAGEVESWERQ